MVGGKTLLVANAAVQQKLAAKYDTPVEIGYPFQTRLALGKSNEMEQQIVLWNINLDVNAAHLFTLFLEKMATNPQLSVIILQSSEQQRQQLQLQFLEYCQSQFAILQDFSQAAQMDVIRDHDYQPILKQMKTKAGTEKPSQAVVDGLNQFFRLSRRLQFSPSLTRKLVLEYFDQARLFVDLTEHPEAFLQVQAISAGIPQLTRQESPYMHAGENGQLAKDDAGLMAGLSTYLDTLTYWNEALVQNVRLIEKFSSERLIQYWEGQQSGNV
ncbi:hypothetical protein IV38_GL001904 [Lactobacillus selangorensis]|uniref:Uncharacterized protein n=1 Tax=Lactobacillus selangorensis TaxID=81857 RepID=A0A0R2FPG3_9LACO|nr:hypothetical protein IV38_GL001904 [Lactobacillus selangorensis]KRN30344.1 hypothetical protein IV40_GL001933 [Lactobacillus selangorensis]